MSLYLLPNATELEILGGYFGSGTPATWYVGLINTMPDEAGSGIVEVSGTGYARQAVTNNLTNFPAANPTLCQAALSFGPVGAGGWTDAVGLGFYTASSGGSPKFVLPLANGHKTISSVDTSTEVITTSAAHGLVVGDLVRVEQYGGALPGGLAADTTYTVASVPTTTTLTLTGVNLTSAGYGWIRIAKWHGRTGIVANDTITFAAGTIALEID